MKQGFFKLALLFTLAVSISSCEKTDEKPISVPTSNSSEEAADRVGYSATNRIFISPSALGEGPRYYQWYWASPNQYHAGIDYCGSGCGSGSTTQNIVAIGAGRVTSVLPSGDNRGLGKVVIIEHKMETGANKFTLYAHLNSITAGLATGQYVQKGFVIGKMGKTGTGANNVIHLHFEMKNASVLGHNPDCQGSGCVGYVHNNASEYPASLVGYFNPNSYIGSSTNKYQDIVVNGSMPASVKRTGPINVTAPLNSPFSLNCKVDLRLVLTNSSGVYLGTIQEKMNQTIVPGANSPSFYKASLSSPAGSNYKLQVELKYPGSATWYPITAIGDFSNPNPVILTN